MSYIDKQALRERHSPQPVPKCRICGDEMTVQRIYGSHITYGCTGATYDDKGCHYAEGRSIADDHYEQSRVTVVDVSDPDVPALLDENIQLQREKDAIEAVALALRDDMRQAREQLAALTAEPVSQTYELPELIEGMVVSIDVSTCDADAGNRYFGTVTEVSELDTAKNGYILLVQDAEPNFDVNGNSPVTQDGWISCSERMPDSKTGVLVAREFGRKGDWRMKWATYIPWHPDTNDGWLIPGASWKPSHWMPLPEPPQEEK
ncbi:DUF551 domain-containing protein [Salmonella enterica subsp. enterica serovar Barranquilla]|nr:DUF551 domain-containing protein [Salmonella enterica]EDR6078697.1 DUF551 domain-containing protein [Salmonella enterica subsp. enterica serovar Barranquilla]